MLQLTRTILIIVVLVVADVAIAHSPNTPRQTALVIPESYGGAEIQLTAWLRTPDGPGAFGTVVLLHGCNGLDPAGWRHLQDWAAWLNGIGFAAMILDSLSSRNLTNVCQHGEALPGELQAADLYVAADYVSKLTPLRDKRIGAIGFSHGGWGILEAAAKVKPGIDELATRLQRNNVNLSAFVAMYPGCFRHVQAKFYAPLLILIGQDDDWTRAQSCQRLVAYPRESEPELRLKVYPNATHSFDVDLPPRTYFGHALRYDSSAASDARAEIEAFLIHWLK
jgi:dienelactone hydrolase